MHDSIFIKAQMFKGQLKNKIRKHISFWAKMHGFLLHVHNMGACAVLYIWQKVHVGKIFKTWAWCFQVSASWLAHSKPESPAQPVPSWMHKTETLFSSALSAEKSVLHVLHLPLHKTNSPSGKSVHSQVGDSSFTHSARDGFHRRAQRVQQRRQLSGAFRLPALLHDEPGHGDHVGVDGSLLGHGGGWSPVAWE